MDSVLIALDDWNTRDLALLDSSEKGLFVGPGVYRTMERMKPPSVPLAAASEPCG